MFFLFEFIQFIRLKGEIVPILDVNGKEAKMRKIPDDLPDKLYRVQISELFIV